MKNRIAVWATVGFLVAGGWAVYAFARVIPLTSADQAVYTLALLTQPVLLAGSYFHFGIHFYWVLLANIATYALIGLAVESLRQQFRRAN